MDKSLPILPQPSAAAPAEGPAERPPGRPVTTNRTPVRYLGVDYARFIAISGMIMAHLVPILLLMPNITDGARAPYEVADIIVNGTAAAIFAILGGISIVFATRSQLRANHTGRAIASVLIRGILIFGFGLLLTPLSSNVVVVLTYYGIAMILVSPLAKAPSWLLATLAAVLTLAFGWINIIFRRTQDIEIDGPHVSLEFFQEDPGIAFRTLFVTGEYPAITWVTYLLIGMLIGRVLVAAAQKGTLGRSALKIGAIGLALFAVMQTVSLFVMANLLNFGVIASEFSLEQAYEIILHSGGMGAPMNEHVLMQFVASPHSGSIGDLLRTTGIAALLIGGLVWLCDRERPESVRTTHSSPLRQFVAGLANAIRCAGAAPLTIYSLHIIVTGTLMEIYYPREDPVDMEFFMSAPWWVFGFGAFALQIAGAIVVGAILAALNRRGPLEALLSTVVGWIVPKPAHTTAPSMETASAPEASASASAPAASASGASAPPTA